MNKPEWIPVTWQDVNNKYKDTELMKEFVEYLKSNNYSRGGFISTIKDIWGYFQVWAKMQDEGKMIEIVNKYFDENTLKETEIA